MRIRKTDSRGDWVFGRGFANFYRDVPDAPALLCTYNLQLWRGQWWLDTSLGVPWDTQVIGHNTASTRDIVLYSTMISTQGVTAVASYSSNLDRGTRAFSVSATLYTQYSTSPSLISLQLNTP